MMDIFSIIGILIIVGQTGGVYLVPPPYEVVVRGGHFTGTVQLIIYPYGRPRVTFAAFLTVENLPTCVHPRNVRVRDESGQPRPYKIDDHIAPNGNRNWSVTPPSVDFTNIWAVVDIDFVNECTVA